MTSLAQSNPDLWQRILSAMSLRTPLGSAVQMVSTPLARAAGGIPIVNFNLSDITFTAGMAKRAGSVFAGAPIVQGKRDGSTVGDLLSFGKGSLISGYFYANTDAYQGSISFWVTPEWNGNDGIEHHFFESGGTNIRCRKRTTNVLQFYVGGQNMTVDATGLVAGTMYFIVIRWDTKNKLDGTNYACISINDVHTFGITTAPTPATPADNFYFSDVTASTANSIIQGFTIYRRPLWDGTYGKDVGNGDEINQIWAAGVGKDPCLVTGSWDVVYCMPTNSTVGALVSGTGEAWSHPHESELLTDWYYGNKFYNNSWSVYLGPTSHPKISFGKTNGLDNLQDNEVTIETWINVSANSSVMNKGQWLISTSSTYGLYCWINCATTNAMSYMNVSYAIHDNKWHHVVMYFNDAGDRKIYLAIDGVWITSYAVQQVGVGAIINDSASNLTVGDYLLGKIGWSRISNNDRYNHGVNFTPSLTPPAPDANTIAQWNMAEGTGVTVDNAEGTASRDGTITAGTWTPEWITTGTPTTPAADLATAEKIYNWGWKFTAAADLDGIKQTWTGRTAGADYVLRCVAHSSDANPITVQVYDETNAALIKDFDFGGGSTVTAPGIALFSFELPTIARGAASDCTSFSVKIMGTAAGQVVYVHQVECLNNLIDNPSLDTGAVADPWIPYGWTNSGLDVGDSEMETVTVHSTGGSLQFNVGASGEYVYFIPTISNNKYYCFGGWLYNSASSNKTILGEGNDRLKFHNSLSSTMSLTPTLGSTWTHYPMVGRCINSNTVLMIAYALAGGPVARYIDDYYLIALTDVSLTVTPASQANSLESGGIRVDGLDKLIPNPAVSLPASACKYRIRTIPRHSAAVAYAFKGSVDPRILYISDGTTNNVIDLHWSAANTIKLIVTYGGVSVNTTWDATGAIVAGTNYLVEVWWAGGTVYVDIDGVNKITLAAGVFGAALTALFCGSNSTPAGQADAVYLAP